ncbi:DUF5043 domain-containing protein [uncultured Bacteroides sp.]|uniref:DUF5043 domain-containing protein n=1 Tax=uncultured Bacteroides sp. TaxID=162156 RepID=UPI0025F4DC8D|nr:DUF5043 domain-containing protein [uncultured Bacteroides sp.]
MRDVEYRFPVVSMLATVPVSVYHDMEMKLKKEIVFDITEKGLIIFLLYGFIL